MKILVVFLLCALTVVIECDYFDTHARHFKSFHKPPFFRRPRHNYSLRELNNKVSQWEDYIEKYLDRAINVLKSTNSTVDLQIFEELRQTDVPMFFNATRAKVREALGEGLKETTQLMTTTTTTEATTEAITEKVKL